MHDHIPGESLWEEYWAILTDPAHALAELTFTMLDIIILSPVILLIVRLSKQWLSAKIQKEHDKIDMEHGINDHGVNSQI